MNFPIGVKESPLNKTVFVFNSENGLIAPGSPEFIVTEDEKIITTEGGLRLITEG